jgi:alpha-glucosidase
MMKLSKFLLTVVLFCSFSWLHAADIQSLRSPDGKIAITFRQTDKLYYAVDYNDQNILWYSPLSLTVNNQRLGYRDQVVNQLMHSNSSVIKPYWWFRSEIPDNYNELELVFAGKYSVIFRAYNDGIAYRWTTGFRGDVKVQDEEVEYRFPKNYPLISHQVGDFQTSYEKNYTKAPIQSLRETNFTSVPVVVEEDNVKVAVTEADLFDYPGMYLTHFDNNSGRPYLHGIFPAYPEKLAPANQGSFNLKVLKRANYLAQTSGSRLYPWRVFIVAPEDKDLAANDIVYRLARKSQFDASWVQPGKVSWEWWNDWNLEGVTFRSGINMDTYRYYIDFAARHHLKYVLMDEGWSDQFDILLPKPGIDVPELVRYGKEKGVKLLLWTVWHTIDRQMDEALALFEKWGVAGIKVDFIDRDDQVAVNFYERLAAEAAKHHLLVDYHGCSKPTGLERTYPNVLNFESVRGNEYNKFTTPDTPEHNVDITYIRMLAGPMDYTPGAMRNAAKGQFHTSYSMPMSDGTRCQQLGMYICYFAPLQMLCDAPTEYEKYPDILKFLSGVPVTWDETIPLAGKLGEYVVLARRKGTTWYIGALNNWTERTIRIDLSFIGKGQHQAQMFVDGVNADRRGDDYMVISQGVSSDTPLEITLKPGGGTAIRID